MDIFFQPLDDFHIDHLIYSKHHEMGFFHYHSCYELFIVISGNRNVLLKDKILQGRQGDIFLIPPDVLHRTIGGQCARIVVNFSLNFLKRYFTPNAIKMMLSCFDVSKISLEEQDFDFLFKKCQHLISENSKDYAMVFIDLAEILLLLSNKKNEYHEDFNTEAVTYVSNTLKYINKNSHSIMSLDDIANNLNLSKWYLCKIFKKSTGVTLFTYLNSVRLKQARLLLTTTSKSITEISFECGFNSSSYFSKIFTKNFNMPPLEYRKNFSEKNIN